MWMRGALPALSGTAGDETPPCCRIRPVSTTRCQDRARSTAAAEGSRQGSRCPRVTPSSLSWEALDSRPSRQSSVPGPQPSPAQPGTGRSPGSLASRQTQTAAELTEFEACIGICAV